MAQNYGADAKAMQYVNRLADYLYVEARFADHQAGNTEEGKLRETVIQNVMKNFKTKTVYQKSTGIRPFGFT